MALLGQLAGSFQADALIDTRNENSFHALCEGGYVRRKGPFSAVGPTYLSVNKQEASSAYSARLTAYLTAVRSQR